VSGPEREAFARLCAWGLVDAYRRHHPEPGRYTWWDYRAGMFHKNYGMRIDHLLVSAPLSARTIWAEIDREARKGKPVPSDHAPLVIDVDAPGVAFDAGWASAEERIAARRGRPS
jgi:exodeoxyribonuclease-3